MSAISWGKNMLFSKWLSKRENDRDEISFLRLSVGGLALALLANAAVTFKLMDNEKTIIVPPEIHETFWVSGNSVSKEYLMEMAYWYSGVVMNITPQTGDYQKTMFLRHAVPSAYGQLEREMNTKLDFIRKSNASTQLAIHDMTADEKRMKVAIGGVVTTWMGDKRISERPTTYVIGFQKLNGRLHVAEFRETNAQDPFGLASSGQPGSSAPR